MKLTLKLAAAIFAASCLVLMGNVYLGIRLQTAAAEDDAARDQRGVAAEVRCMFTGLKMRCVIQMMMTMKKGAKEGHQQQPQDDGCVW